MTADTRWSCIVFWPCPGGTSEALPLIRLPSRLDAAPAPRHAFLVGWSFRGFTVTIAAMLLADDVDTALDVLDRVRRRGAAGMPSVYTAPQSINASLAAASTGPMSTTAAAAASVGAGSSSSTYEAATASAAAALAAAISASTSAGAASTNGGPPGSVESPSVTSPSRSNTAGGFAPLDISGLNASLGASPTPIAHQGAGGSAGATSIGAAHPQFPMELVIVGRVLFPQCVSIKDAVAACGRWAARDLDADSLNETFYELPCALEAPTAAGGGGAALGRATPTSLSETANTLVGDASSNSEESESATTDVALRMLRERTDVWVELRLRVCTRTPRPTMRGVGALPHEAFAVPELAALMCCGMRYDAALHLVRYSPLGIDRRNAPAPFSPLVRLQPRDVEAVMRGERASKLMPGARSVLEGAFLPAHALNLMPEFDFAAPAVLSRFSVAAAARGTSLPGRVHLAEVSPAGLDPTIPPRLVFPTVEDFTDFAAVQLCLGAAVAARRELERAARVLQREASPPRSRSASGDGTGAPRTRMGVLLRSIFAPAPAAPQELLTNDGDLDEDTRRDLDVGRERALQFLAPIAATLSPIFHFVLSLIVPFVQHSYILAYCEYKLRELLNVLAMIAGTTNTCGLHPVLPHSLHLPTGAHESGSGAADAFSDRTHLRTCSNSSHGSGAFDGVHDGSASAAAAAADDGGSALQRASRTERTTCILGWTCRQVVDLALGWALAAILGSQRRYLVPRIERAAWWGLFELHQGYLQWFMGWPAGFKLNDDLSLVLHDTCLGIFQAWAYVVMLVHDGLGISLVQVSYTCLLACGAIGGAGLMLSFTADCCRLGTLHLRNLFHLFALFYRLLTSIARSLLLMLRGKRRNVLRKRIDSGQFSADEVVLGAIACTVAVFLLPTLALYYFYLACARTTVWVLQEALRGLAVLCSHIPLYPFLLWVMYRRQLYTGITLSMPTCVSVVSPATTPSPSATGAQAATRRSVTPQPQQQQSSVTAVVSGLALRPLPFATVTRELGLLAHLLFAGAFSPGRILSFIIYAERKPIVDVPNIVFRHLLEEPARPKLAPFGADR